MPNAQHMVEECSHVGLIQVTEHYQGSPIHLITHTHTHTHLGEWLLYTLSQHLTPSLTTCPHQTPPASQPYTGPFLLFFPSSLVDVIEVCQHLKSNSPHYCHTTRASKKGALPIAQHLTPLLHHTAEN